VRQPLTRSGLEAATLLEAQMRDPHRQPVRIELPLELVSRRTTSPFDVATDSHSTTPDDEGRATPM
jgi:hypothetical protein